MISKNELLKTYECRPFKIRNADEFDLNNLIDIFVDPTDGLKTPFDYENSIIKGRMGSGKTMYLRANYAYYRYMLVPSLLEKESIILPIYIRLSDFQGQASSEEIYKGIIIKIIEEMANSYVDYMDAQKLKDFHKGLQSFAKRESFMADKLESVLMRLSTLNADEYIERTINAINGNMGVSGNFWSLSLESNKKIEKEIKIKKKPSISDINSIYEILLRPFEGKLLILLDEAGSLSKSFFKNGEDISMFETLMNQLRTLDYIRTKIAVYPNSYSDVLPETRYGDSIILQENIKNEQGYDNYLNRTITLIENYIEKFSDVNCSVEEVYHVTSDNLEVLEQIIYASDGNMRRLVQLLDLVQNTAYKENHGLDKMNISHVHYSLKEHARTLEQQFIFSEIELLTSITSTCKARNAYMFRFPNKSIDIQRFTNKSSEYNIINLVEHGSGRKGAVYSIDYTYAFYKEIPTHYLKGTERIDKSRCMKTGCWIEKITSINDNIIEHSKMAGKIEGSIDYVTKDNSGFVMGDDKNKYFFSKQNILEYDKNTKILINRRVRFLPYDLSGTLCAYYMEIL